MESILEVLTPDNLIFIFKGFGLTLYISLIAIVLSTLIGTVLAVMRNGKIQSYALFPVFTSNLYVMFPTSSGFSLSFSFQNEIHTSRNHCLHSLYLSSPS